MLLFLTDMRSYQVLESVRHVLPKRRLADGSAMKCNCGPLFKIYGSFENLHRIAYLSIKLVSCVRGTNELNQIERESTGR